MKKLPLSIVIITFAGLLIVWMSCSRKSNSIGTNVNAVNNAINPGFEENFTDSWEVSVLMGAKGSGVVTSEAKRSGEYSTKLSKTNSFGYLQLSSKKPVRVEAGKTYTLRFWFNSSNAQVTSFLIPRLVTDNSATSVANPRSGVRISYDYEAQSLMRNSPSTESKNWIKRVVFYENKTDKPQDIYLQVMLYGNPFDVYLDDFEFISGKILGTTEPANPTYNYTKEEVLKILAERKEESAKVSGTEGTTHFYLDGKEAWPVFYRGIYGGGKDCPEKADENKPGIADPAGFAARGVVINNVVLMPTYWTGPDKYDWEQCEISLMEILRKNPNAKLLLDLAMDPGLAWVKKYPGEVWQKKDGKQFEGTYEVPPVSYSSAQWRKDGSEAIRHLIADLKKHGFWKIVVGVQLDGGHDWQFWTKALGEYAADYSQCNINAYQQYLKENYHDIHTLNSVWRTKYTDFKQIEIPDPSKEHETNPAIIAKGALTEYRQFSEANAFDLRECFARAVKENAGKDVFVCAYGMPHENQHNYFIKMAGKKGKANDMIASMSFYPYRQPGFASGYHPEQSFGFHNTGFMQELDLRSYASDRNDFYDELSKMWCSAQPTIADWRNMHRKLVGISLAQNQGYWYYDMDKQFIDKDVLDEIGTVKKIADNLVTRKGVEFRPDVCLIRFGAEGRFYGSSVDNTVGATVYWQYMLLETSGVPFDVHYLSDIMQEPALQKYKVYLFHNNTCLSEKEKEWITKYLKKDKRTLVWMYDCGYVTEKGLSAGSLSALTGMNVKTAEGYTRAVAAITGNDILVGSMDGYLKVPEFQGMAEVLCSIFTTNGPAQLLKPFMGRWKYTSVPGASRYQKFWIESGYDNALAIYKEDDKTAMAVKRFPNWTSVYFAAPNALAGEMFNNIAQEAGAYRCGPAAMGELRMSGRFVSYHALRSGKYVFRLPKGASKVIDPETGKVLSEGVQRYNIDGKAQSTYWYFIE